MIQVGVLIRNEDIPKKNNDFNESANSLLIHMAASYGIDLFLFSPADINLIKNTINGLFIENGKSLRREVPIPLIIDNKTYAPRTDKSMEKLFSSLKKKTNFTREPIYFTKLGQYKRISEFYKSKGFSELAIPTLKTDINSDFIKLFDILGDDIILKPENSSRGRGVFGIKRQNNSFCVINDNNLSKIMSSNEFNKYYNEITSSTKYIAQKRIYSYTASGRPFDIRILIQRKDLNSHAFVLYPRIGGGDILSNLATGGNTMPIDLFLEENFKEMAFKIKESLIEIAKNFPVYYQNFLKHPFFDLGLDIGIEVNNNSFKLWLFEVNFAPQFAFKNNLASLHMEIARATLECYINIYNELIKKNKL